MLRAPLMVGGSEVTLADGDLVRKVVSSAHDEGRCVKAFPKSTDLMRDIFDEFPKGL